MDTIQHPVSSKKIRRLLKKIGNLDMKTKNRVQTQEWIERAECSVSGSMRWMFRVSQLVGVAPVRFDGRRVSVSRTLCVVHCAIMTVMNILATYGTVRDLTVDLTEAIRVHSSYGRMLWVLDVSFVMLIASVTTYTASNRVQEVIRCLSKITKIKKRVLGTQPLESESKWFERKKYAVLVSFLVFTTTTIVVDYWNIIKNVLDEGKDIFTASLYSCYEAAYVMMFVLEMQFLFIALEIYDAFKVLNDCLEKVSRRNSVPSYVTNQSMKTVGGEEIIIHLASAYNNLCVVMKRIEKAFSFVLTILMSSCLYHMVLAPNNAISAYYILATYGTVRDLTVDLTEAIRVHSSYGRMLWVLDVSFVMLIASVTTYTASNRVQEVIRCLSKITKIKKRVLGTQPLESESKWFERKKYAVLVSFLVFTTTTIVVDYWNIIKNVLDEGKDIFTASLYSCYEAAYVMMFMLEMQFLFIALEIYDAFKVLNDCLEKAFRRNSVPSYVTNQSMKTVGREEIIIHLASAYNNLCVLMKRIEKAFSFVLTILMSSCLYHMVLAPNNAISAYLHDDEERSVLHLIWCALHLLRTVVIIEPPHLTQVEMDRTQLLVSQLILQNSDGLLSEELEKFSKYLLLNKVTYTPMGICTLGRPLLATMLGSVATYLVILIQLSKFET